MPQTNKRKTSHPSCRLAPRGLKRRRAMLEAASTLFLEKGFENTSLSDIVEQSKGSRSTLYKYFENKEGLLRAMVEDMADDIWRDVTAGELPADEDKEAWLTALGIKFLRACLAPRAIALFRILVSDGHRVADATAHCFDTGPRTLKELFSERLAPLFPEEDRRTRKRKASIFLGCVMGDLHFRLVLGLTHRIPRKEMEEQVRTAVKIFLYGTKSP